MGRKTLFLALCATLAAVLFWGCTPLPPAPPTPPEPSCADACSRWRELGCALAEPTPAGQSCEQVCAGVSHWNLECMSSVERCEAIDACPPARP
jgi:hypothetical protein